MGFPLFISKDSLHKLLEEVSKTINNLDVPTESASSASSATPETSMEQLQGALSELEAYFSLSVGAALLDEATLLRFKQASELLVHKPGFLGEGKCYLLRHDLSQLDDLVQSLHISVQKDQETFSLMEKQKKLIDTRDQYKSELNTCSARMSEMVLKYQQMKQYHNKLISTDCFLKKTALVKSLVSFPRLKNFCKTRLKMLQGLGKELKMVGKVFLQSLVTLEASRFRQRDEDGWKGLSSVFKAGFILFIRKLLI